MIEMKKILLTGGGTAGHVIPHLALLPYLTPDFEVRYIGSADGVERTLIEREDIPFYSVTCAKLRRSADISNLGIPFKVLKGKREAARILGDYRPDIVFSKGGFVAVPAVLAAAAMKIPVVAHESDITPGLANRLTARHCAAVCTTFECTAAAIKGNAVFTGSPVRKELFSGSRERHLTKARFSGLKPVLLVMGGSLGAAAINAALREALPLLVSQFDIIHICGKGNLADIANPAYVQYEFSHDMPDIFAAADIAVSRAGSNSICEMLALRLPMLLVPLPKGASRGDQLLNAAEFEGKGYARVLAQENLTAKSLTLTVQKLYRERALLAAAMSRAPEKDGTKAVYEVITRYIY